MRRFFYTLVIIATVVAFFRSELADDLLSSGNGSMTNWFNKLSDAAEEQAMAEFKQNAEPLFVGLKPHQIEYANHVMKDRETLGVFYLRYCQGEDLNPYIYGVTLQEFCEQISNAAILNR